MISANLRLAYSLAKKRMRSNVPFEDLIQEANIGLMHAVDRFEWRKGFRFSTYATWWIRQRIARSIDDTEHLVRKPVHMREWIRKLERSLDRNNPVTGEPETLSEVARRWDVSVAKVERALQHVEEPVDIHDPDGTGRAPVDWLAVPQCQGPSEEAEAASLHSVVLRLLNSTFEEREREIIILRFGLRDQEPMTLEEVGQRFDVTRERIRQIEAKVLRKLRHPSRAYIFEAYRPELGSSDAADDGA
jgi:RNA polymerase primary sigma factor